jgi:hypothetical protein
VTSFPKNHLRGVASIMKSEPILSDREVLAGLVERVTYQNAENGFCVIRIKARGHRDLVTWLAMPPPSLLASGLPRRAIG